MSLLLFSSSIYGYRLYPYPLAGEATARMLPFIPLGIVGTKVSRSPTVPCGFTFEAEHL